jgi:sulfotransferase
MKLHFISGLPRSGSTLLTSILYQNPDIHTEGVSGLCDLMWNVSQSVERTNKLSGNSRDVSELVKEIPSIYYSDVERPVVIDKCRAWTLPLNIGLIKKYISEDPKIVCCTRKLEDIETSFVRLFADNGRDDFFSSVFAEELQIAAIGLNHAMLENDSDMFLFVDYDDLVSHPNQELTRIYEFLGLPFFEHDFDNVVNVNQENDSVYGLDGMHDVRKKVGVVNV